MEAWKVINGLEDKKSRLNYYKKSVLMSLIGTRKDEILEEYRLVLSRTRFGFEETILEQLFLLLSTRGQRIAPREDTTVVSPDPDDTKFILCSLEASADFLVTGNRKHFPQAQYGKTAVVNARELIEHVLIRTSLPSKL
jgi:predicted nucleic acid-binding protein